MQGRFKLINILFTHNDYKVYHVIFMLEVMKLDFGFKLAVNNSPKLVVGDPEQHWSTSNQHVSSCANESTRWRPISTRSDVIVSATFFFFTAGTSIFGDVLLGGCLGCLVFGEGNIMASGAGEPSAGHDAELDELLDSKLTLSLYTDPRFIQNGTFS